MAGWGEALQILGGAGAGGFKAAGDVAEEEIKGIRIDMLQAALDKRADNLKRWESEEAIKERGFKAGESKLDRESRKEEAKLGREATIEAARIKAGEPGTFEEKYNFLVKIYGKDKAESLIESSFEKSESGAAAKSKIDALSKAYELRDTGAPLEDINQVLKAGGVEEWVVKKIIKKEKGWFGTKDVEEEVYGPPEKKGLLGGTAKEEPGTPATRTGATGTWAAEEEKDFGKRADGTQKGMGFLGVLKTADGETATEISIGVNIGGKEMEIPTLVPTLSEVEKTHLLSGKQPTEAIVQKAIAHAKKRISEGKSVFAEGGESKGTSLDALLDLVNETPTTTQKPGLLEKPPTKKELGDLLRKSETYQRGAYKPYSVAPGERPSFKEQLQTWAGKTTPKGFSKFGEGNLEAAIRQAGFGKDLAEVKDMAANLKKQYPKLSEKQLIELVKKVAAGG